jgi:hypothetical protein
MPKFQMGVTLKPYHIADTARLGGDAGATPCAKEDNGKFVKLAGDSRYDLCAVGDKIEGVIQVADDLVAKFDGYVLGAVMREHGTRIVCVADGSQAAGTGSIAVGDYVVAGTPVAKGTAMTLAGPKVRKATNQPGTAVTTADATKPNIDIALAAVADQAMVAAYGWRVVAILSGTGAVGDKVLIERV